MVKCNYGNDEFHIMIKKKFLIFFKKKILIYYCNDLCTNNVESKFVTI